MSGSLFEMYQVGRLDVGAVVFACRAVAWPAIAGDQRAGKYYPSLMPWAFAAGLVVAWFIGSRPVTAEGSSRGDAAVLSIIVLVVSGIVGRPSSVASPAVGAVKNRAVASRRRRMLVGREDV